MSEILIPIAYQLGIGGIGGFFVGYAVKKITRIAIIIGVGAFFLIYLVYTKVINVDYDELVKLTGLADPFVGLVTPLLSAIPFLFSFLAGLWIGLKKG